MTLFLLSLVAGFLTVLAPCTLPLLPVIIGGSIAGERNLSRATRIALALSASVFLFTLILKVSTAFIGIPQYVWQEISGILLIGFGIVTLFPKLWDKFSFVRKVNKESNKTLAQGYMKESVWGDLIVGASLGPVFSSCSPTYFILLATVLPSHFATGIIYLIAFSVGLFVALLLVSFLGQKLADKLGLVASPDGWFKKLTGVIFLAIGIVVFLGLDKPLEQLLVSHAGNFDVSKVEQKLIESQNNNNTNVDVPVPQDQVQIQTATTSDGTMSTSTATTSMKKVSSATLVSLAQKMAMYKKAPEIATADAYLNTGGKAINLAQYKGKNVVLIDFWTYSCINCLRTVPYLTAWDKKYRDQGLVIIGIHTPEFAFEHVQSNVEDALKRLGINYPVLLDNEYQTWNAFNNQFWPREILIDMDGYIVHDHAGEGEYDKTEASIQKALKERNSRVDSNMKVSSGVVNVDAAHPTSVGSPETYFGSARNEYLGNGESGKTGAITFTLPTSPQSNLLYLGGSWNISQQYATGNTDSTIEYQYSSGDVYFVASGKDSATIEVLRDGVEVGTLGGVDVDKNTSMVKIGSDRLYHLVHETSAGTHTLQLKIKSGTIDAYTFTFG